MALDVTIGGGGALFLGEDKHFDFEVLDPDTLTSGVAVADDTTAVPVDLSGWTTLLVVRDFRHQADPAVISTAGTVMGTYNAVRATNTQRVRFTLTDTETALLQDGEFVYSAKRTNDGSETVFAYGDFIAERATQI